MVNADIDSHPFDETPLMASVKSPKIMKLLLDSDANVSAKNRFGKNALFYAVQFGSKETVEILLNKSEHLINSKIYSRQTIEEIYEKESPIGLYVHPTIVADFTPLIYAKRYASQEVIDLLIKHGADGGAADPSVVIEWIKQGSMDL